MSQEHQHSLTTVVPGSSFLLLIPVAVALSISQSWAWKIIAGFQLLTSLAYNSQHSDPGYIMDLLAIFLVGYVYIGESMPASRSSLILAVFEVIMLVSAGRHFLGVDCASPGAGGNVEVDVETADAKFDWIRTPSNFSFMTALLLLAWRTWYMSSSLWVPLAVCGTVGPMVWRYRLHLYHTQDLGMYAVLTWVWHACVAGIMTIGSLTL